MYVKTKDDTIGAKWEKDKLITAKIIEQRKVVELIEDPEIIKQIIDVSIPVIGELLSILISFFSSVLNPFPCIIAIEGKNYVLTMQKAPLKAIDKIFYMNEEDKNDIIFPFEGQTMQKAKNQLKKELKNLGYIN